MNEALTGGKLSAETKAAFEEWLEKERGSIKAASAKVIEACETDGSELGAELIKLKEYLIEEVVLDIRWRRLGL
jgi:hypothetical protein